jgi:hypothetical protein
VTMPRTARYSAGCEGAKVVTLTLVLQKQGCHGKRDA